MDEWRFRKRKGDFKSRSSVSNLRRKHIFRESEVRGEPAK